MKRITKESKIDAYNMAINYLLNEQCAYDNDGDYAEGREWLACKLSKELNRIKGES